MKILIASSIHQEAIDQLNQTHDVVCAFNADEGTLKTKIIDRDILIFRSGVQISRSVMECAPRLKLLVRAGSGLDNVDLDFVRESGRYLVRVPGPGARAVAEMAFTLMFGLARQLLQADHLWRQGHWVKYEIEGHLLQGKVLGIIGAGNIGSTVGQIGAALGMEVIGCVEHPNEAARERLLRKNIKLVSCEEVCSRGDFVSIHVPLKDSTRNMIDGLALALMKPGAFLVNLARGGVVDEKALLAAITEGRLKGAALDVHEKEGDGNISPLAHLQNVILTPHIGAMAVDSQAQIGKKALEVIEAFSRDGDTSSFSDHISIA